MARKNQKPEIISPPENPPVGELEKPPEIEVKAIANHSGLIFQAWASVAVWMSFGLLVEGLLGFRNPTMFGDETRREMFRLAHAHGTLLSLMLLGVVFTINKIENVPNFAVWSLRIGTVLMPVGFLLAGIQHFPNEPGLGIWLVPPAALLIIFGAITIAFASFNRKSH